jgi:uncharacterized membrane protein YbhN (UPF0104 family)
VRRAFRLALRLGLSVALVALALALTDAAEAGRRLAGAAPGWLLLAGALLTAQTVLMALRWRLTAARLGLRIAPGRAVGEYYLAQVVNTTLPGGVLGDVARAFRTGHDRERAAHAVLLERVAGQASMLALAATGAAATLAGVGAAAGLPSGIAWAVIAAFAALLATAAIVYRVAGRRGSGAVRRLVRAARRALLARRIWPVQASLGAVIAGLNIAAFVAAARATGTVIEPSAALAVVPLILFAMLVPATVGGWGWREGAAATLFPVLGAMPAAGVAASVAFGAVLLATTLPGLLWPLVVRREGSPGGAARRDLPAPVAARNLGAPPVAGHHSRGFRS